GVITAMVALLALAGCGALGDPDDELPQASGDDAASFRLRFPAAATKNTTRVGGGDELGDVAGAATAAFPATSEKSRPNAVALVDREDWQSGVAASVLAASPVKASILLSDGGDLPEVTADTLERLRPKGSSEADGAQVILVGNKPPAPDRFKSTLIDGSEPYGLAASIDRFYSAAKGKPSDNVIVASGERSEFAMPAAAWAARSGDSVLFTTKDSLPEATRRAINAHERPRIFVLGPETVVSPAVEQQLGKLGRVRRIDGRTPVENAIAFARFQSGRFGWGITVPGYNFALASTSRPLDAAASASLATNGIFAPLLVTDSRRELPRALEGFFLDVQPGYETDPSQGVYNRVFILGDEETISQGVQARLDSVTELVPVDRERR
ncbi:MAG: cell wall-binding repeat-containing protein, partial [Actinomycetota bacterium]|nr:cell wall-binding repeat-containing protein [Actinomycetota bacterium]